MTTFIPFTELFPVLPDALPKLHAYLPPTPADATAKTAAHLARAHGGRWAAVRDVLLTDEPPATPDDGYQKIARYKPTPSDLAAYVIGALVPPLADTLYRALEQPLNGNFRVLLRPLFKPWTVDGGPALSIGLAQNLVHRQHLADYAKTIPDPRGLERMTVVSRAPLLDYRLVQGVVASVAGTVGKHREALGRLTRTQAAQKRLDAAPDAEPVVTVMTPFGPYQYAASALYITLSVKDYARLRVDAGAARKAAYQNIDERARGVAAASAVLKAMDYIGDAYRADKSPKAFLDAGALGFAATIALGDHTPRPYEPRKLWAQLGEAGPYGLREDRPPLVVGVLSALGVKPPNAFDDKMIAALEGLGVPVTADEIVVTPSMGDADIVRAFKQFEDANAVVAFFVGKRPTGQNPASDWARFLAFKRATFEAEAYSLCLWENDLNDPNEAGMAFAAMLGHAPFALGEPLAFADLVVGLVVAEKSALAVVYDSHGVFVGYIAHNGPLDKNGAARLLPEPFFKGTRIVLHTTRVLTMDAHDALTAQAKRIKATLHLGAVDAGANPNLYALAGKSIRQPPTGTAFLTGEREALLVPAMPPHPAMPVNPARVTTSDGLPIKDALRAVLAMNTLHPTARKPRTPRHLVDAPAIRQLLAANVRPAADEGAFMWWL